MASTPPPPSRLRTPPTPLHGPKYDSYEPYSPRRSRRVAAQRSKESLHHQQSPSLSSSRNQQPARTSTPTRIAPSGSFKSSSQTFSPPSSPNSPRRRNPNTHRDLASSNNFTSDPAYSDSFTPISASKNLTARLNGQGALPTPSKTPRKRSAPSQAAVNSTARVLFAPRPATIEEAMPTPKRSRRTQKNPITLQSFAEATAHDADTEAIEIYTDFKDRMPSLDGMEDNPFIGPRKQTRKGKGVTKPTSQRSKKREEAKMKEDEMEEAAKNDEGIIYVFRGKKVFRKFEDAPSDGSEIDSDTTNIRRRVGGAFTKRLTRSSIKPRVLFPSADKHSTGQDETGDEAVTEIDESIVHGIKKSAKHVSTPNKMPISASTSTPTKAASFRPASPPTTVKSKRATKEASFMAHEADSAFSPLPDPEIATSDLTSSQSSKRSPFDSWLRTKPGSSKGAGKGGKRSAEPLESEPSKRARNAIG